MDAKLKFPIYVGATASNNPENAEERGHDYIVYENFNNEALIPGSQLMPHSLDDPTYSGVFQVAVEDQNGQRRSFGTGSFVRLKLADDSELFGFLTCYHVIKYPSISELPPPYQIFVRHNIDDTSKSIRFKDESAPVGDPIYSETDDFYFLVVSDAFKNKWNDISFLEITDKNPSDSIVEVLIPQFLIDALNKTDFYLSKGLMCETIKGQRFKHKSSTLPGTSGAPIMIHIESTSEHRVIGMHQGNIENKPANFGLTVSRILAVLKTKHSGLEPTSISKDESML